MSVDLLQTADQEFILAMYRAAVQHYQPSIEKRTGIQLGQIKVWNHSCLYEHILDHHVAPSRTSFGRFVRALVLRRKHRRQLAAKYAESARSCAACYYRSGIYVSFASDTPHEEAVAMTVVHELAHAFWEKLSRGYLDRTWRRMRGRADKFERYKLLIEGFATYAEYVWFVDFYPACVRDMIRKKWISPQADYLRGLQLVRELVAKHGTGILMELPRKWRTIAAQ